MGNRTRSKKTPVMTDRFAGKVAVVTGTASGIGRATALRLGREGATVVAADISAAVDDVVGEIVAYGGTATAVRGDIHLRRRSSPGSVKKPRRRLQDLIDSAQLPVLPPEPPLEPWRSPVPGPGSEPSSMCTVCAIVPGRCSTAQPRRPSPPPAHATRHLPDCRSPAKLHPQGPEPAHDPAFLR